ncbi:hypothetical protein Ddye_007417 [Dipteronia dyeriana]|uniref:Uncharacterized protein n=1 Tax=Dipteronia dyeriana TaxID=168575 RepID=A0AAD9XJW5_9ROSI|nr:hypothetical protein Ddye_007415 [Dipteronia dyeriana]KAK2660884.1 hypothetical protein Ddye_007417 [Dipteronia dyeriana]
MTNRLDHQTHKRLDMLKKSLSDTLTRFYPLAGKIKDDLSIECNDEGAYFVETRVNCCLDECLNQPDIVLLVHKFLPCEPILKESSAGTYVTNIQVNVFECGGIAIGLCISHKILDGAALSTFLKAWTTTARGGGDQVIHPNFIAISLFPTNDSWLRDSMMVIWGSLFKMGKCVTRRFVFNNSAIAALKAHVETESSGSWGLKSRPTRVETISAFIWKSAMAAFREKHSQERPSLLTHLVNLRTRMSSAPLSSTEHSTGNLLWLAAAYHEPQNYKATELNDLVGKVRDAISEFDGDYVKRMIGSEEGDNNMIISESLRKIGELASRERVDYLGFTSWCKLGFYEMDFGWGKPIWVSSFGSSGPLVLNLVVLVETRVGGGIEAWMTLDEQDMGILESDPEFLRFASVDPSPLAIGRDCSIEKVYNAAGCTMHITAAPEIFPL